ncbi:DNA-binding protein [Oceanospirillum sediminis]|uniref:DNA-binding protein n=1 Tax=Oceanospirillum sediminis TaxID=2760088 RepID=A0A839IVZ7_9GAMM|nr:DNA-binding protein [Oceanospirillum sediminis]MBB1489603.1 DNA-binding protein [Oceanospirillum sediminis]
MDVKPDIRTRIINAANHLVAKGNDNPTNEQVRQRLGGGSLSHISPVMREWRQERKEDISAALQMPDELKQAVQIALGQVWSTASDMATAQSEQIRTQAREEVDEISTELSESQAEIARLEKALTERQLSNEHQARQLQTLEQTLTEIRTEKEKTDVLNATLTTYQDDYRQQIDTLREELREARSENKALQQELIEIVRSR